jgi:hypothetical protein
LRVSTPTFSRSAAAFRAEIAERRKAQRTSVPMWVTVPALLAALSVGLVAGPTVHEKLGLGIPMAAERIQTMERQLHEARDDKTKVEAKFLVVQSQVKQLTTEKEAALRDVKRLTDQLAAAKSEAAFQKTMFDTVRAQLDGAIKRYYSSSCRQLGEFLVIRPDGSAECQTLRAPSLQ